MEGREGLREQWRKGKEKFPINERTLAKAKGRMMEDMDHGRKEAGACCRLAAVADDGWMTERWTDGWTRSCEIEKGRMESRKKKAPTYVCTFGHDGGDHTKTTRLLLSTAATPVCTERNQNQINAAEMLANPNKTNQHIDLSVLDPHKSYQRKKMFFPFIYLALFFQKGKERGVI